MRRVFMRRLFGADSLRSVNRCSLGTPPHCGGTVVLRRLFGADSLRSVNRCSFGTPPRCGGTVTLRRLFGADSLRSNPLCVKGKGLGACSGRDGSCRWWAARGLVVAWSWVRE